MLVIKKYLHLNNCLIEFKKTLWLTTTFCKRFNSNAYHLRYHFLIFRTVIVYNYSYTIQKLLKSYFYGEH
jgi:hypothetical protein